MPSGVETATGLPATGTRRPENETRSEGSTETSFTPRPTTASCQSRRVGTDGPPGLGAVEEAGDEELRRPVGLLLGVEAAGHELERHAGGGALEDAQRLLLRLAVRLERRGLGLGLRGAGRRLLGATTAASLATATAAATARLRDAGHRGRGDGPVGRHAAVAVHVLEPVEVRRPVDEAGVHVAVLLALGRGAEPGDHRRVEPRPGAVRRRAPVQVEAEVVQLRRRLPLHQHRRVEAHRAGTPPAAPPWCRCTRPPRCPTCPSGPGASMSRAGDQGREVRRPGRCRGSGTGGAGWAEVRRSSASCCSPPSAGLAVVAVESPAMLLLLAALTPPGRSKSVPVLEPSCVADVVAEQHVGVAALRAPVRGLGRGATPRWTRPSCCSGSGSSSWPPSPLRGSSRTPVALHVERDVVVGVEARPGRDSTIEGGCRTRGLLLESRGRGCSEARPCCRTPSGRPRGTRRSQSWFRCSPRSAPRATPRSRGRPWMRMARRRSSPTSRCPRPHPGGEDALVARLRRSA